MQEIKGNTRQYKIQVSNLVVDTIKKDIKNMHLGVYPPYGRIRVAAPLKTNDEAIRLFVMSKIPWIKKQQSKFLNQERQTQREYVSGESHYFMGRRYRLNVIHTHAKPKIEIRRKSHLDLHIKSDTTIKQSEKIFDKFYRSEMGRIIPQLLEKWQEKIGIQIKEIRIKKMKTRWGTCHPKDGRIWLNSELAKKPVHCLEYVLVHELIHLIEKSHSDRFVKYLGALLPHWNYIREQLNKDILGYSRWECKVYE